MPSHSDLKRKLEAKTRRCGVCLFCSRYEIYFSHADLDSLRTVAGQILAAPVGSTLKTESVLELMVIYEKMATENVYCRRERCWTHIVEPACSLWQPRAQSKHETANSA